MGSLAPGSRAMVAGTGFPALDPVCEARVCRIYLWRLRGECYLELLLRDFSGPQNGELAASSRPR